jgi:uncharacterized iron-regulated membrane protein
MHSIAELVVSVLGALYFILWIISIVVGLVLFWFIKKEVKEGLFKIGEGGDHVIGMFLLYSLLCPITGFYSFFHLNDIVHLAYTDDSVYHKAHIDE